MREATIMLRDEEPFNPVPAPPHHEVSGSDVDALFELVGTESIQEDDVERNGAGAEK